MLRELDREGQVYFVHNRVQTIDKAARRVLEAMPEARVAIAHGQMHEELLAQRMLDFIARKYDVLVATTIIENGLDIPNVNTIIVDEADRFGLADLHQLRGRVGRYKHRAYAYFLLPEGRPITPEGQKRLQAIEHFSELGAGFRIAMRDMEIRGVGNVLGKEQSGHVAAVGYELYCRLLADAVAALKGQEAQEIPEAHIEVGTGSHIPVEYVESPTHRLDIYKRLSTAVSVDEVEEIEAELADRFGPVPAAAEEFLMTVKLRILAYHAGLRMIMAHKGRLVIQSDEIATAAGFFRRKGMEPRVVDETTAHVLFAKAMPSGRDLAALLINILQVKFERV
jgi:transcription-repair coupling factor (superfamily II helicase)